MKIHNIQLNKVFPDGFIPCNLMDLTKIKTKRDVAREQKAVKKQRTFYYVYYNRGMMEDDFFTITQSKDAADAYCESLKKDPFVRYAYYETKVK